MKAPELRALYVKIHQSAPHNLEAVKVLAAHSQPSHSTLLEPQPWETSMRDDSLTLQGGHNLQACGHGKEQVSQAEDGPKFSWFRSTPPYVLSPISGNVLQSLHMLMELH